MLIALEEAIRTTCPGPNFVTVPTISTVLVTVNPPPPRLGEAALEILPLAVSNRPSPSARIPSPKEGTGPTRGRILSNLLAVAELVGCSPLAGADLGVCSLAMAPTLSSEIKMGERITHTMKEFMAGAAADALAMASTLIAQIKRRGGVTHTMKEFTPVAEEEVRTMVRGLVTSVVIVALASLHPRDAEEEVTVTVTAEMVRGRMVLGVINSTHDNMPVLPIKLPVVPPLTSTPENSPLTTERTVPTIFFEDTIM